VVLYARVVMALVATFNTATELMSYASSYGLSQCAPVCDVTTKVMGTFDDSMTTLLMPSFWRIIYNLGWRAYEYLSMWPALAKAYTTGVMRYNVMCVTKQPPSAAATA